MGRELAVRPAGCVCPWQQVHMDLPWQKVGTDPDCPVHGVDARAIGRYEGAGQEHWDGRQ